MESLKRRFRISINDINEYEYNIIIKKIIKKLYNTQEHYDNKTEPGCNYKSFYDSIKARTPREDYDKIMTFSSENGSLNKKKLTQHIRNKKKEFWDTHELCFTERNLKYLSSLSRRSSSPEKIDLKGGTRRRKKN
jgi:hypothetical protein